MSILEEFPEQIEEGLAAEDLFDQIVQERSWEKIRDATENENKYEHWDKLHLKSNLQLHTDVKNKKSIKRWSIGVQSLYILLELHGVASEKNTGWIYGKADIIAFHYESGFLLFSRKHLVNFIKEKMGITSFDDPLIKQNRILSYSYKKSPHWNNMKPYTIYYRLKKGSTIDNKDAFIWVPIEDLMKLPYILI